MGIKRAVIGLTVVVSDVPCHVCFTPESKHRETPLDVCFVPEED
jgi:hypothetical protein